jgi:hypothetical protein
MIIIVFVSLVLDCDINIKMHKNKSKIKFRLLLTLEVFFFILIAILLVINNNQNKRLSSQEINKVKASITAYNQTQIIKSTDAQDVFNWWNVNYSFSREIYITNSSQNEALPQYAPIKIEINHADLVKAKKSQPQGYDLRIYEKIDEGYRELPVTLENANTTKTKLFFSLPLDLLPKRTTGPFILFYGNLIADPEPDFSKIKLLPGHEDYKIRLAEEKKPSLNLQSSRLWILKNEKDPSISTIHLDFQTPSTLNQNIKPEFKIITTKTFLTGPLVAGAPQKFSAQIAADNLSPGIYQVQASVAINDKIYNSQRIPLIVSEPLFIAHTIDWEGYDAADNQLKAITDFSGRHNNLPTTFFFNPRIYISNNGVSENRAKELTQWIINRSKSGDEVALHLHMYNDLVSAAGAEPKKAPSIGLFWQGNKNSGYDIPSSAYPPEDFKKILDWSLNKFSEKSLGKPTSFRAGLWWINLANLKILGQSGFLLDSSGRDQYKTNGLVCPWDLKSITSPYLISAAEQNTATVQKKESINLWEFPNNGGNTSIGPAKILENSFSDNFHQTYLQAPQVITYLSHVHNFSNDAKKLDPVFNKIDRYTVNQDQGPVVYTTLKDAYTVIAEIK